MCGYVDTLHKGEHDDDDNNNNNNSIGIYQRAGLTARANYEASTNTQMQHTQKTNTMRLYTKRVEQEHYGRKKGDTNEVKKRQR